MSVYPQQPQSIGKVLDSGIGIYRQTFKQLFPLSFLVALLSQLPQIAQIALLRGAEKPSGPVIIGGVVLLLAWLVVYLAMYNGWLKSLDTLARGRAALGLGEAFAAGRGRILTMIGAGICFMLAVGVGFVLLVIPGVYLMTACFFFWFFIVLEDKGALESLRESRRLVSGHWWRTTTVMTIAFIIYMIGFMIVGGVFGAFLGVSMSGHPRDPAQTVTLAALVMLVIQVALNALLLPMLNSIMLAQFHDLQLRKSGADLAARAAAA